MNAQVYTTLKAHRRKRKATALVSIRRSRKLLWTQPATRISKGQIPLRHLAACVTGTEAQPCGRGRTQRGRRAADGQRQDLWRVVVWSGDGPRRVLWTERRSTSHQVASVSISYWFLPITSGPVYAIGQLCACV